MMRDLFEDEFDDILDSSMTFYEYAEQAMNFAVYDGCLIYPSLGLTGEAGEFSDKVAKLLRDDVLPLDGGDPVIDLDIDDRFALAKELGDVLWMVTAAANDLGFDLDEIAQINIDKLSSRHRRGSLRGSGDNR